MSDEQEPEFGSHAQRKLQKHFARREKAARQEQERQAVSRRGQEQARKQEPRSQSGSQRSHDPTPRSHTSRPVAREERGSNSRHSEREPHVPPQQQTFRPRDQCSVDPPLQSTAGQFSRSRSGQPASEPSISRGQGNRDHTPAPPARQPRDAPQPPAVPQHNPVREPSRPPRRRNQGDAVKEPPQQPPQQPPIRRQVVNVPEPRNNHPQHNPVCSPNQPPPTPTALQICSFMVGKCMIHVLSLPVSICNGLSMSGTFRGIVQIWDLILRTPWWLWILILSISGSSPLFFMNTSPIHGALSICTTSHLPIIAPFCNIAKNVLLSVPVLSHDLEDHMWHPSPRKMPEFSVYGTTLDQVVGELQKSIPFHQITNSSTEDRNYLRALDSQLESAATSISNHIYEIESQTYRLRGITSSESSWIETCLRRLHLQPSRVKQLEDKVSDINAILRIAEEGYLGLGDIIRSRRTLIYNFQKSLCFWNDLIKGNVVEEYEKLTSLHQRLSDYNESSTSWWSKVGMGVKEDPVALQVDIDKQALRLDKLIDSQRRADYGCSGSVISATEMERIKKAFEVNGRDIITAGAVMQSIMARLRNDGDWNSAGKELIEAMVVYQRQLHDVYFGVG